MERTAKVSSLVDALALGVVAVLVNVEDGEARVSEAVPATINGVHLARTFSREWCEREGLTATAGSLVVLRTPEGPSLTLVSIGSASVSLDGYRLAGAALARAFAKSPVGVLLSVGGLEEPARAAQAFVEGALLASYSFKPDETDAAADFALVPLAQPLPSVAAHDQVTRGVERGVVVASAVNWAKRLVDTPAGHLTPKDLARAIDARLAPAPHVGVEIWNESKIREERLGGLLGVGSGSAQPTRVVYANYQPPSDLPLPRVVLVGKGITFDSGGLSLKPAESMMTMKTDMTGAAIVMAAVAVASELGLRVRLSAIALLSENLPGEHATKPGDVLTIRDGQTIEVLNTDAEGRLILADGLSLATEAAPDAIIDVATLTGAQRVALGDEVGALFASDDALASALLAASALSGEAFWRMPLVDAYEAHLESEVADMKNIGKPGAAGSIVAALVLRRFTKGRAWAHLDIAGPARCDAARGYLTKGATAYGARTLVEYLAAIEASGADR